MVMGETAEVLAEEFKITREEQDGWAALSQHRAEGAKSKTSFSMRSYPSGDRAIAAKRCRVDARRAPSRV